MVSATFSFDAASKRLAPRVSLCAVIAALFCGLCTFAAEGFAQAQPDDPAIKSARDALRGRTRYPWYDRSKDDVRQINVAPENDSDSANRKSKWTTKSSQTTRTPVNFGGFDLISGVLQVLGLGLLIVLLMVLAFLVAKAFLRVETTETAATRVIETVRDAERVQALPFQLRKPTGDFLAEARRLYEAGNYSEAVVYLFSYQLVQLDKHHVIRLAKGKTNRQYLREARSRPVLRDVLDQTMIAFEDVFFGHHPLEKERFEACWQRLDEFHSELERLELAAA
jgi:hypothetical protein